MGARATTCGSGGTGRGPKSRVCVADGTAGWGGHAELTPKHPLGPPRPPDSDLPPADASDLQGRQLLAGLDKVASDLDRQEKAITAILRPPLEQGRAVQDSAERAKDLKVPRAGGTGWPPGLPVGPAQSHVHGGSGCSMGSACHVSWEAMSHRERHCSRLRTEEVPEVWCPPDMSSGERALDRADDGRTAA